MRRQIPALLAASLAVGSLAFAPVDLGDDYVPVFNAERQFAHCGDTEKLSNAEGGTPFAMDTTAPAASFTQGGGCGTADVVLTEAAENDAGEFLELTTTHTGNLDALTLELHMIDAGIVRLSQTAPTGSVPNPGDPVPTVAFDEIYADMQLFVTAPDGTVKGWSGEARLPAERSSTGASVRMRMTLKDIGLTTEETAGEHTITLKVKTADYYNGDSGGWVLDATEVPTGIEFSPAVEDYATYQVSSF